MIKSKGYIISFVLIFAASFINLAIAGEIYYEEDFNSGTIKLGIANPVWSLPESAGLTIGSGNIYEVVSGISHSGQYSLRFNYDGRNGICNTCGGTARIHKSGNVNANYFIDSLGADLSADPIKAEVDRIVYNRSNGFSKWKITEVVNDKLTLAKIADSINGLTSNFNEGDDVVVYRSCGVDGTVGGNIDRRSDCNVAINYYGGMSQSPGESIYRRLYFMIGAGAVLPDNSQKFRYWDTETGAIYLLVRVRPDRSIGLVLDLTPLGEVSLPGFYGININLEPNVWYYMEEQFKAESSITANDGEYRLWVSKAGEETNQTLLELTGRNLGVVKRTSLWGNHQHLEDAHGYWYFDDIKISNVRGGPTISTKLPAPPEKIGIE